MDPIVNLCRTIFERRDLLIIRPLFKHLTQLDHRIKVDIFLKGTGEHVVFSHAIEEKTLVELGDNRHIALGICTT